MQKITRTILNTRVNFCFVDMEGGKPIVREHSKFFEGIVTEKKVQKVLTKEIGKPCTVTSIEQEGTLYGMPLETFMKYAEKIEKPVNKKEDEING